MNPTIKKQLIAILVWLNRLPGFRRVFYWIHEIRCTPFTPKGYIATLVNDSFLLGVYNMSLSPAWQRMATESFEEIETKIIKQLAPFFDTFLDIGSHIGYFTCLVGTTRPTVKILAFEPNPNSFKSLMTNIKVNHLQNVTVFNIALSNKVGSATLYGDDAMSSINLDSFSGHPRSQTQVEINTLNSFTKSVLNTSAFIKMDVEAKEYDVLSGGKDFIQQTHPVGLIIEICKLWSGGENPNFKNTFDLLTALNYTAYLVGDTLPLQKIGNIDTLLGANYLFIRNDMVATFTDKTALLKR